MQEIKCPKCGTVISVEESDYAEIVKQVRDREFSRELQQYQSRAAAEQESAVRLAKTQAELSFKGEISRRETEIERLKSQAESAENRQRLAVTEALSEKEKQLAQKDLEILRLKGELQNESQKSRLEIGNMKSEYELQLKLKDETIEQYKDFKLKLSTKMIGEDLEQYCLSEFNKVRMAAFPNAYFEKDNDARQGSKGDFIFRDITSDGIESTSIMFEMKNEADSGSGKKKNEDFFDKLDKDRRQKGCEYAVLVSMLEPGSDYYNTGIVDVSYRYPKMYVIRPAFFIPMITLIRNFAQAGIESKRELAVIRNQNLDLERFRSNMEDFKQKFGNNFRLASEHYEKAIDSINKTIKDLEKTRDELSVSMKQLKWANDKAQDLSVELLTEGSPSIRKAFDELAEENL